MKRTQLAVLMAGVLMLASESGVWARELTVEDYVDLTMARLNLAAMAWEQADRAPTEAEEAILWVQYGITAKDYYAFRGAHREAVDGYLAAHPEVMQEIERLSTYIDSLIR